MEGGKKPSPFRLPGKPPYEYPCGTSLKPANFHRGKSILTSTRTALTTMVVSHKVTCSPEMQYALTGNWRGRWMTLRKQYARSKTFKDLMLSNIVWWRTCAVDCTELAPSKNKSRMLEIPEALGGWHYGTLVKKWCRRAPRFNLRLRRASPKLLNVRGAKLEL
jgi:hypothetical protein